MHVLARPDTDRLNIELAFPCVWVARWARTDGPSPLRNSLVICALTNDGDLIDDLISEPTIANVYSGHHTTYYQSAAMPHDGYLADFLMRNKGVIRD